MSINVVPSRRHNELVAEAEMVMERKTYDQILNKMILREEQEKDWTPTFNRAKRGNPRTIAVWIELLKEELERQTGTCWDGLNFHSRLGTFMKKLGISRNPGNPPKTEIKTWMWIHFICAQKTRGSCPRSYVFSMKEEPPPEPNDDPVVWHFKARGQCSHFEGVFPGTPVDAGITLAKRRRAGRSSIPGFSGASADDGIPSQLNMMGPDMSLEMGSLVQPGGGINHFQFPQKWRKTKGDFTGSSSYQQQEYNSMDELNVDMDGDLNLFQHPMRQFASTTHPAPAFGGSGRVLIKEEAVHIDEGLFMDSPSGDSRSNPQSRRSDTPSSVHRLEVSMCSLPRDLIATPTGSPSPATIVCRAEGCGKQVGLDGGRKVQIQHVMTHLDEDEMDKVIEKTRQYLGYTCSLCQKREPKVHTHFWDQRDIIMHLLEGPHLPFRLSVCGLCRQFEFTAAESLRDHLFVRMDCPYRPNPPTPGQLTDSSMHEDGNYFFQDRNLEASELEEAISVYKSLVHGHGMKDFKIRLQKLQNVLASDVA